MFGRLLTLAVAYGASCPGFIASECICEGSVGADYTGTVDRTEEGIKCMPWKNAPRAQYRELPENYCRNGNGTDAGLWCYTEGRNWGYCDVPICGCENYNPLKCGCSTSNESDYRGATNVTRNGSPCQSWSSQTPNKHPYKPDDPHYADDGLESNYCRNPGREADTVWCYIADGSGRWDYCDIEQCDVTTTTAFETEPILTTTANIRTTTTTTSTVKIVNKVIALNQSVGIRHGNTYASISANGTTSKPLKKNDYISMKLEGKWHGIKYDKTGKWSFINEKQRKVGEEVDVKVAVFNKDGRKYSGAATITFDGQDAVSNAVIVDGVSNGEYAYDDRFNNISAHGRTLVPLTDGSYVAVNIDGAWQKAKINDEGTWRFDSNKTRTIGAGQIEAAVAILDKNGKKLSRRKYITFDGSDINKVILLNKKFGLRKFNKYAGIVMDGKTGVSLKEGEYISVRQDGKWHRTDFDRSGAWRYKNTAERNAGEKLVVTIALFDAQGKRKDERTAEFTTFPYNYIYDEVANTPNRITVDFLFDGWYRGPSKYRGIGGVTRPEKPLTDGQYIACKYDTTWYRAVLRDGYWHCSNWNDRPKGEKKEWTMALFDKKGKWLSYARANTYGNKRYNSIRWNKDAYFEGYRTETEYVGMSGKGSFAVPLDDGDYIAIRFGGPVQLQLAGGIADGWKRVKFDKSGNWSFYDTKVRKLGVDLLVTIARFNSNDEQQTGEMNYVIDGYEDKRVKDVDVLPQL